MGGNIPELVVPIWVTFLPVPPLLPPIMKPALVRLACDPCLLVCGFVTIVEEDALVPVLLGWVKPVVILFAESVRFASPPLTTPPKSKCFFEELVALIGTV